MFFQIPRRRLHNIHGIWHSFAGLERVMVWPESMSRQIAVTLEQPAAENPLCQLLLERGVLAQVDPGDTFFPLQQVEDGFWSNSQLGRSLLRTAPSPLTVLDALNWSDLQNLPKNGGLVYLGDRYGGFWAGQTASKDGKIPCARCLMLRYLAGRRASPVLYHALRQGATVAFEHKLPALKFDSSKLLCWSPRGVDEIPAVLPLPDCADCLARSTVEHLPIDRFAPVTSLVSHGFNHSAQLGQLIWLCENETVGHGGAYDENQKRGTARAINEALERYAAHFLPEDSQAGQLLFHGPQESRYFSLQAALLREPGSLSTGLACRDHLDEAIADGLREVCERDALARFWLDLLEGSCRLHLCQEGEVDGLKTEIWLLDSYHQPTALCLGRTVQGAVSGSACGPDPAAKALTECLQNAAWLAANPSKASADLPESFEQHLRAYWTGRYQVPDLKRFLDKPKAPRPLPADVYHRDLTPPDLRPLGRHAVRVQVPGLLVLPMSHHDWPAMLGSSRQPPVQPHPFG